MRFCSIAYNGPLSGKLPNVTFQKRSVDSMSTISIPIFQVWRHGDRSPTKTFPTDPFQEGNWTFGGGGFGELSPVSCSIHVSFLKMIMHLVVVFERGKIW